MSKMSKIKVGIIGIGNCAKSLVEGIQYYKANPEDKVGLMYDSIGGYTVDEIEFVVGFDVDRRKVNKPLVDALRAAPNCAMDHVEEILENGSNTSGCIKKGAMVYSGPELDGVAPHMLDYPEEVSFRTGAEAAKSFDDIVNIVKDNEVDAIVSSGNTAALLSSSLMMLGKIEKIKRPALGAFIPTEKGGFVLCDVGANSDNKPIHLLQFSLMASAYIKYLENIKNPKIALLNIGIEKNKGNNLSIDTYKLLDKYSQNFIGNIEARYILENKADIVICDGFTGNIVLKLIEGTVNKMIQWTKKSINQHSVSKLAQPLLYPVFKDIKKNFDYEEHGGAPLLGVNGIVIKCHGASNEKAILNGLLHAKKCVENNFISKIKESLNNLHIEEENQ